jgi:hypothetical protein
MSKHFDPSHAQAQKSALDTFEPDACGDAGGPSRLFDVAWMPGYCSSSPPRWRLWAGRLLPAALRGMLATQELRIEVEASLTALEAYDGLEKMLADQRYGGHIIRGQVADVLCAIEARLARLQYEHPALCAEAGAQRAAVSALRAAGSEVQRLHDEFKISSADCESLIATHKRRVYEIRSGFATAAAAVKPPSVEALVADLPLFRALPHDRFRTEWAALLSTGTVHFAAGERLMEAGRPSTGPLVIVSGFAKVFDITTATATGRILRFAAAGRAEGCAEWLPVLEDGADEQGAKEAAVLVLRTMVAETDVEAVRIPPPTLRALVEAGGPEALRELRYAFGGECLSGADPAMIESGHGKSRMASPGQSVRLAWMPLDKAGD